jgi:iron only hydrogenase large subunit-like protein
MVSRRFGPRTQARSQALQLLFQAEATERSVASVLAGPYVLALDDEASTAEPLDEFAERLALGADDMREGLDAVISTFSRNWSLTRMPSVDRNLLRLAIYEMLEVDDVDVAITTREYARLVEKAGLNFKILPDAKFDDPFAIGSGAGIIFGATGGVMEAALRTAAEVVTGKSLDSLEFTEVRGTDGIKRATYKLGDLELKVAVVSGTKNAKKLLKAVQAGEEQVHFIEVMACPGGCVNGGGQPTQPAAVRNNTDLRAIRASVLYNADKAYSIRKSHENSAVQKLYDEFLGKPGSHKAHEILHTSYVKRGQ